MQTPCWPGRVLGLVAVLCLAGSSSADQPKVKGTEEGPRKGTVVRIDLDKLPPEIARKLLELSQGPGKAQAKTPPGLARKKGDEKGPPAKRGEQAKKGDRPISLAEAVAIAEKAGQGLAVKAERKGEGAGTQFRVELLARDGTRSRIDLTATGQLAAPTTGPPKGVPGKKPGGKEE